MGDIRKFIEFLVSVGVFSFVFFWVNFFDREISVLQAIVTGFLVCFVIQLIKVCEKILKKVLKSENRT